MDYVYDDGGRHTAGYQGQARDCVTRAIAIATGRTYQDVYDALNTLAKKERTGTRKRRVSHARTGVYPTTYRKYLAGLGWYWTSTMYIGQGCTVHFTAEELPPGRLIVSISRHLVAVIDGVVHDTAMPDTRGGTRCVYGYFTAPGLDVEQRCCAPIS